MALTVAFKENSTITIGTAEYSIYDNTTTGVPLAKTDDGIFQMWIYDRGNMTKTEEYEFKVYEKTLSGSTQKVVWQARLKGAQSETFVSPPLLLGNGWDMTAKKIAGTDRAFDLGIRQYA